MSDRTKSNVEYQRENYNRLQFVVTKELYSRIQARCDSLGMNKSEYFKHLITNDLENK